MSGTASKAVKVTHEAIPAHGAVIEVALRKLKRSPRNARRTAHSEAHIEALAASIAAKGMLQKPVVEPELDGQGVFTGAFLVTIGEGRRLAQMLRVKRKEIGKGEPVSCVVDLTNDPQEISLDENVTRENLHPADQFEAFLDQSQRLGRSAEEIAARFGVKPEVVKRRLRLAVVSPRLMQAYRDGDLDLDQLMAFAVSEDRERQEQVFEALPPFAVQPAWIRRAMTETKVPAADRRAIFVGAEAYEAAGGVILRDLFTEDRGGWFEDVTLLERLAVETLQAEAERLREAEGWKWAEAHVDFPHHLGLARVYPAQVERSEADVAAMAVLSEEYDTLIETWDEVDEPPPEVEARFREIEAALQVFGDGSAYRPEDVARGGVFVVLNHEGELRVERGFIRPEDIAPAKGADEDDGGEDGAADPNGADGQGDPNDDGPGADGEDEPEAPGAPLSAALLAELTAYRTLGLRDAVAENPDAALLVTLHALALRCFYGSGEATCADIRLTCAYLPKDAPDVEESPAGRRISERHEVWARQMPTSPKAVWAFVVDLDGDSRMALLAHCVSLSLNAVHGWERRVLAWEHADVLAAHVGLDMTTTWTPTVGGYFGRVTKGRIREAVAEAVSAEAAERIAGLKKPEMAQAAAELVVGTGWLPGVLRTPTRESERPNEAATIDVEAAATGESLAIAAE